MHTNFKLWLMIGILLLAVSGCGPLRQVNTPTATVTKVIQPAPAPTDTATPLLATPVSAPSLVDLQMIDQKDGWAWTSSGSLLRTADGGQTWIDRTPGEGSVWEGFSFLDAQTAWMQIFIKARNKYGLLLTRDGGQTWAQISYGPKNLTDPRVVLHFTDALNGWAETWDGGAGRWDYSLSVTRDGGKTWVSIPVKDPRAQAGLPTGTITLGSIDSLYYDPQRIIVVYGDEPSVAPSGAVQLQVSFDMGNTWQSRSLPLPKNESETLVSASSPTFFSGGNGLLPVELIKLDNNGNTVYHRLAFYATLDGGENWAQLPGVLDNIANSPQLQVISPKDIFFLCGSALCASHDGAQTWQQLASNLDFGQSDTRSVSAMNFVNANTGWALIQQNENSQFYKTTDGGVTWNHLNPLLAAFTPVTVTLDVSIPTPTRIPTPTLEPTPTPNVVFDPKANADRIRFVADAICVEISDTVSATLPKCYVLSAMQGQVMSISIPLRQMLNRGFARYFIGLICYSVSACRWPFC